MEDRLTTDVLERLLDYTDTGAMHIAIAADWLTSFGGAEHVLATFHAMYPSAPIFTTVASPQRPAPLKDADIRTSSAQQLYRLTGNHQVLLPLLPRAMEELDVRGYDVILSSSHVVGKGIIPDPATLHVCYCHTPARYAWEMEEQYLDDFRIPRRLRPLIKKQLMKLRRWDMSTAKRVDAFIANSTTTQERIKRIYNRESTVISPPVDDRFFSTDFSHASDSNERYFLAVGRLVPYKRFDLIIQAANELKLPLKVAGRGQDEARLRKLAGPTVEFLGFVPDRDLPQVYAGARALLFPQYEDAGIVPLEAQACGTPVIAYNRGGVKDAVQEGTTGIFFDEQSVKAVEDALARFQRMQWDREAIRRWASHFSTKRFTDAIDAFLQVQLALHTAHRARPRD